jgi:hypothetical protein
MTVKHTEDEIKDALFRASGLLRPAAAVLGVSVQGLRARINRNQSLQKALIDAREQIVDKAEESLWNCIDKQEPWAVALVLKTLGKNRGYVERQEVTGADSGPVDVRVVKINMNETTD